jgi:hypothetical protein
MLGHTPQGTEGFTVEWEDCVKPQKCRVSIGSPDGWLVWVESRFGTDSQHGAINEQQDPAGGAARARDAIAICSAACKAYGILRLHVKPQ